MNIKKILTGLSAFLTVVLFTVTVHAADSTVVISGNTSAGENLPGWMFNRDATTSTPFTFNTAQSSIGSGSLYVQPIGANASDKFIAENFINAPISDINAISYDYMIGSGGDINDDQQFYMNVYANFGVSSDTKFYDCRYVVVPTVGSLANFTTVSFDPSQAYPVTQSGTSPFACPAIPNDMNLSSTGSTIRVFAINVGDTSTSDVGLDGYLDKVVVNTTSGTTTYDLDPHVLPTVPVISTPANGASVTVSNLVKVDWSDSTGGTNSPYEYQYQAFSDAGYTNSVYLSSWLAASEIPTPGAPVGEYYLRVKARDASGMETAWSNGVGNVYHITVTADVPVTPTPTVITPTPIANLPLACTGMTFTNVINGTNKSETLNGTSGNDLIFGGNGSDFIDGKGGDDCIVPGNGSSVVLGGAGDDVIVGGNSSDSINGEAGMDKIYGNNGSDYLVGGADADQIWGGNGSDLLSGDGGADKLYGEGGSDVTNGGAGSDTCVAESKNSCEL